MHPSPSRRACMASAVIFGVLSIAGIASIGHFPSPSASPTLTAAYVAVHADAMLRTNVLLSLANGALLAFFACLVAVLGRLKEKHPLLTLAFGGAVLLSAIGAASASIIGGMAHFGTAGVPDAVVKLLLELYLASNAFSAMPAALAVGSVGCFALVHGGLPRPLALATVVVAALELGVTITILGHGTGPAGAYATGGLFGSLTMWSLVTGVVVGLAREDRSPVQ